MSRWSALLLATVMSAIGATSASMAANPHQEEMPEILWGPTYEGIEVMPIFVADKRVLLGNGEVDSSLLRKNAALWIETVYLSAEPEDPCYSIHQSGDQFNSPELHWSDFSSTLADADHVVVAKVTGIQGGVKGDGIGGSLIRLRPIQWLKGDGGWDLKYLPIPAGNLQLGDRSLCLSHGQFSELPGLGDRIVLAYPEEQLGDGYPWIAVTAPNLITLKGNDKASLSRWVRSKHPDWSGRSASALISEIRKIVREQAESEKP